MVANKMTFCSGNLGCDVARGPGKQRQLTAIKYVSCASPWVMCIQASCKETVGWRDQNRASQHVEISSALPVWLLQVLAVVKGRPPKQMGPLFGKAV